MDTKKIYRAVQWKDLVKLNNWEIFVENNITIPWLATSLVFAYKEWYLVAVPFSIIFFLTGLRQVHNGFHNSLGTNRYLTWWCLFANSMLMMISVHAVQINHLRHHKYCMKEEDHEGKAAKMKWWQAMLYGPIHVFMIHKVCWQKGSKSYRRNMVIELLAIAAFATVAIWFNVHWLVYHMIVMVIGECFSAFFAVWTVHHDIEDHEVARTQRDGWKNRITFSMFYHLEHHLFPAVPTIKLPELARRLDKAAPDLKIRSTF